MILVVTLPAHLWDLSLADSVDEEKKGVLPRSCGAGNSDLNQPWRRDLPLTSLKNRGLDAILVKAREHPRVPRRRAILTMSAELAKVHPRVSEEPSKHPDIPCAEPARPRSLAGRGISELFCSRAGSSSERMRNRAGRGERVSEEPEGTTRLDSRRHSSRAPVGPESALPGSDTERQTADGDAPLPPESKHAPALRP